MSLVALSLNLLLAALLLCALVIGVRLERRLKAVRDGQLAFVVAISELDAAAHKAKEGLAELRGATDEATDVLGGRIARAEVYVGDALVIPTTIDRVPEFPVLLEAGTLEGDPRSGPITFVPTHRSRRLLTFRFDRDYPAWVRRAQGR